MTVCRKLKKQLINHCKTKLGICQFSVESTSEKGNNCPQESAEDSSLLCYCRIQWEKSVTNMLSELQWPTLKQHCFVTCQNLLWKAINNQVAVSIPPHIKPSGSQSRGHNHTFTNICARTVNYKYSFFPKRIHCWNLLLPNIVQSITSDQFTNALWKEINTGQIHVMDQKSL